jgi:Vanadium chloroperoxidase N-terminal domain
MTHGLRGLCRAIAVLGLGINLFAVTLVLPADANDVLQWNETAVNVTTANAQFAPVRARSLAMTQAAVHDALNAISRRYEAYYFEGPGDPGASPEAAVAAAAHTVLVGVIQSFGTPAQKVAAMAMVEQAYAESLARVTDASARNRGVAVGRAAGAAMLTLRKDDGATRDAPYTPGTGPGRWRPHPNPVPPNLPIANPDLARGYQPSAVPGWGNVTPFT